jgi:hypothetical protein
MGVRHLLGAAAIAVGLIGCANKYETVTPELQASMLADLRAGRLSLDCGQKCSLTWFAQASSIHAIDRAENWTDLAVRVMQIGYGDDLAYYYLGQAAQGLGYHKAAIAYYNYAFGLANGADPLLRCESAQDQGNDPCQGVDIAGSIPVLIQASRDALAQAAPRRRPKPHSNITPASAGPGWVAPPPAGSAPASAPAASAGAGGPGWVAPPPAPSH